MGGLSAGVPGQWVWPSPALMEAPGMLKQQKNKNKNLSCYDNTYSEIHSKPESKVLLADVPQRHDCTQYLIIHTNYELHSSEEE